MKWFKHDSMALYDPNLRNLGDELGAVGLWIYWGITTYIACHCEDFQVKVVGAGEESGKDPVKFNRTSEEFRDDSGKILTESMKIPEVSLRDLSGILFTTRKKLLKAIDVCVSLGLFDPSKWNDFKVLYSSTLALNHQEYSKKVAKSRDRVRTMSGQAPKEFALEQEQDVEEEQTQKENKMQSNNEKDLKDLLKSASNAEKLSTPNSQAALVPPVSDEDVKQFRRLVWEDIRAWNLEQHANFDWIPTEVEIGQLLRGGSDEHKLRLCYQAMNLLGGDATYPHVVRRAVRMMLEASNQTRITNPYGWLWTCLNGNAGGTPPWVQLATRREES